MIVKRTCTSSSAPVNSYKTLPSRAARKVEAISTGLIERRFTLSLLISTLYSPMRKSPSTSIFSRDGCSSIFFIRSATIASRRASSFCWTRSSIALPEECPHRLFLKFNSSNPLRPFVFAFNCSTIASADLFLFSLGTISSIMRKLFSSTAPPLRLLAIFVLTPTSSLLKCLRITSSIFRVSCAVSNRLASGRTLPEITISLVSSLGNMTNLNLYLINKPEPTSRHTNTMIINPFRGRIFSINLPYLSSTFSNQWLLRMLSGTVLFLPFLFFRKGILRLMCPGRINIDSKKLAASTRNMIVGMGSINFPKCP